MPLLNKKNFVINDPPPNLRDDEEVFYSELTNEIFRDYEEFCERIFLCNSLVWSCSYTGRSSLTYQEAVNTEQVAKKMLNEFPLKLRIPVLYLTTLTERSSLIEFAEDVFAFARDRYFIGEEVEVDFTNDTWTDCRIIKVQYPTQKQLQELNQQSQKTKSGERDYWPPAGLYSYEVEEAGGDRHTVAADKVRRRKNVYTREKNRLYIKQFVERQGSVWKLKKSVYLKYGIDKVKFDMIFCGPAMVSLAPSKKKPVVKKPAKDPTKKEVEKQKVQGSIDKYFAKKSSGEKQGNSGDTNNSKKPTPKKPAETPQKTLVQKLKNKYKMNAKNNGKVLKKPKDIKTEKTEKLPRGRKKKEVPEKKALTKDELQKLAVECKDKDVKEKFAFLKKNNLTKEEKVQVLELVKEYTKFREDLECSSLKELPAPLPIQMRLPNELFGDFLHMLEFFNAFSNVVSVRDFFSGGITFELLERALVEKEVAGPLSDVIHVLLVTLFELQDQEEDLDDKLSLHSGSGESVKNEKLNPLMNLRLAVAAATYSQQYHGHPISELTLDSASITEVLRLHILASGRRLIDESDSRGPIMTVEDPCSELCLRHPNLLNELSQKSIFELPIEDKVLIINSLINQILSFASIKESIEEELENLKLARVELRSKRAAEVKRIKEAEKELKEQQKAAVGDKEKDKDKSKENKEKEKEKGEAAAVQGEGGDGEEVDTAPKTRLKLDKNLVLKARELAQLELRVQCQPLGMDRAYRRYWLFYSTPGLFVEDNEPFPGTCVPRDVIDSLSADSPLKYVRRLFDGAADDKENLADGGKTGAGAGRTSIGCSPSKKLLAEKNGDAIAPMLANIKVEQPDKVGLMCTGDAVMCPIHGAARPASWSFYKDEADLNALIEGLSKYGVRESQLRKELVKNKQRILDSVKRCPHYKLNPSIPEDPEQLEIKKSTKSGPKYLNPHLDFPPDTPIDEILISSLRYMILETEEKIFAGHIGKLKVKDRTAWRDALNDKSYDRQCDELSWGPKKGKNLTEVSSDESEDNKEAVNSISQSSAASDKIERLMRADVESPKKEVLDLACAILQIEQAIEHRFLKKPFGIADCKEKDKEKAEIKGYKLRERWESSLMASCSISQLFVHIYSLDNHIAWSRSALKALCRVCRRASNPESMLLCDMCNKGHHMSCLKPPLKKVPEGDWFCPRCVPKPTPVKRSRKENMDVDESDAEACRMLGRCKTCKSEGELVMCDSCESGWHFDCINPPLRKQPRSKWTCAGCRQNSKRDEASVSPGEVERSSRRRCAKAATAKISHFAKQLRTQAWDDSGSAVLDEDERADDSNRRRSSRRESAAAAAAAAEANSCSVLRSDLPLDNAALQEMLDALMHHKDAWPFLRPVTKAEVPDYRTIIKKPMDFGTIKHKLNMLEYSKNSQVIADALLVFDNCYTYNQPESEVFKAGERLQKMFEKLCSERKMNIDVDYEVRPPDQKKPKLN